MIKKLTAGVLSLLLCANFSFAQLKAPQKDYYSEAMQQAKKAQENHFTVGELMEGAVGVGVVGGINSIASALADLSIDAALVAKGAMSAAVLQAEMASLEAHVAVFVPVAAIALLAVAGKISYEKDNFSGINQAKRYPGIVKERKKGWFPKFTVCLVDAPHVTAQTLKDLEKFLGAQEGKFIVEKIGQGGDYRIYFSPNRNVWIDMDLGRKLMIVRNSSIRSASAPRVDHF
ncbi:MAG: hypothetical protein J5601_00055, partial [Elusimicrobiaceae bacterium]|nr:hypothetical protein [Elusimicrobiaceae bacterium]